MNELQEYYVEFLNRGFIVLKQAIDSGSSSWLSAEYDLLHNIPSLVMEENVMRHYYFWISERDLYLQRITAVGLEEPISRMKTYYEPLWKEQEPFMEALFEQIR